MESLGERWRKLTSVMIEQIPISWLFKQEVPLVFFIIALLTRPSTWTRQVVSFIRSRLGGEE